MVQVIHRMVSFQVVLASVLVSIFQCDVVETFGPKYFYPALVRQSQGLFRFHWLNREDRCVPEIGLVTVFCPLSTNGGACITASVCDRNGGDNSSTRDR